MANPNRSRQIQPLQVPSIPQRRPTIIDYNRTIPPLADQPFLELRRPSFKDACFTTSALSPHGLTKRNGTDWETSSKGICLLDRYLSQEAMSPIPAHDIMPSPCTPFTPFTPLVFSDIANALPHPGNSKNFWAYRAAQQTVRTDRARVSPERYQPQELTPIIDISPASSAPMSPADGKMSSHNGKYLLPSAVYTPMDHRAQLETLDSAVYTPMGSATQSQGLLFAAYTPTDHEPQLQNLPSAAYTPMDNEAQSQPPTPMSQIPAEKNAAYLKAMKEEALKSWFSPTSDGSSPGFSPESDRTVVPRKPTDTATFTPPILGAPSWHIDPSTRGGRQVLRQDTDGELNMTQTSTSPKQRPSPLATTTTISVAGSTGSATPRDLTLTGRSAAGKFPNRPKLITDLTNARSPTPTLFSPIYSDSKPASYYESSTFSQSPPVFSPQTPAAMPFDFPVIFANSPVLPEPQPFQRANDDDGWVARWVETSRGRTQTQVVRPQVERPRARSLSPLRSAYPDNKSWSLDSFIAESPVTHNKKGAKRASSSQGRQKGYVPSELTANGKHAILQTYFQR